MTTKAAKTVKCDVLVAGGGPAGLAAAVAASREGARTILIEKHGVLGGAAASSLVGPFMVSRYHTGEIIYPPIFKKIVDRLRQLDAAVDGELFGEPYIAFDTEILKQELFNEAIGSRVRLYLHTLAVGAIMKDDLVTGVLAEGKSGQFNIFSKVTIDATGDADIAWMAGAEYKMGRASDGLMQPATLFFKVGGVDRDRMPSRDEMNDLFLQARKDGRISAEREKLLWFQTTRPSEISFNVTRVAGIDGTSVEDLTRAEITSRRQAFEVFGFLKKEMPGFETSYIMQTGEEVGIRETRRIVGEYVLTEDDVVGGRRFEDEIAKCSYPIDIHDPKGEGVTFRKLQGPYGIPMRCMIPEKIEGLIVAGRSISADSAAFSSVRVMPTCFALGEAAGISAARSVKSNSLPRDTDIGHIKEKLKGYGANYI